ncbi:MAG: hypothetical protein AB8H47_18025 [Bacteroidia bacterium]
MDILERIIENLTSDEVRRFKILSNRFKADEEKKLLILFDAIRAGNYRAAEADVITQFYGDTSAKSRNSYYRLRNKLLSNLEKSLLFYHFNYKNSIEAYSYIQLAILFRERGLYPEAFYHLRKAEKNAVDQDQFNVIEVIYDEMVKLAVNHDVDIEKVIKKRRENQEKIEILRASNEVLGMITSQLRRRNFSRNRNSQSVIDQLEQIKNQLEEHKEIFHSPANRVIILMTVVSILIQKSAYAELEDYVRTTFEEFEENKWFNKENHPLRIKMRIWRINSLQKLLKLDQAQDTINHLLEDLKMYKRQNYNEFAFHYFLTQVNNYKLTGQLDESAKVLKSALKQREMLPVETQELYLLISLSDQYFNEGSFEKALETIKEIGSHKIFQTMDIELRFYIRVFELVNLFEAGMHKQFATSFKALRKKYRTLLKDEFYDKAERFIDILLRMSKAELEGKKVFLKSAYRHFVDAYPASEIGGNQIIPYEVYLQAKMTDQQDYYSLHKDWIRKKAR